MLRTIEGADRCLRRIWQFKHWMAQWKKAANCFQLAAFVQANGQRRDQKNLMKSLPVLGFDGISVDYFPRLFPRFLFATLGLDACRRYARRAGRTLCNVLSAVASMHHPGRSKIRHMAGEARYGMPSTHRSTACMSIQILPSSARRHCRPSVQ